MEFVDLPDVVLVTIMAYLTYNERFNISLTCQRLNTIFHHPSLWCCLKLTIFGNHADEPVLSRKKQRSAPFEKARKQINMLSRIGISIQDLEIEYWACDQPIGEETRAVFSKLTENGGRLKSLALSVIGFQQRDHRIVHMEDIDVVCSLVLMCEKLKSFTLRSWPNRTSQLCQNEVLETLISKEILVNSIKRLNLFWPDRTRSEWAAIKANQIPENTVSVIGKLKNLRHLSLPSNLLSGDLLKELVRSRRFALKSMRILVTFSSHDPLLKIPEISPSRWVDFICFSPEIEIEIIFSSSVPSNEMAKIFSHHMPVSAIYFMKYSRCSQKDIFDFSKKFSQTLRRYINLCDVTECDNALINMVNVCPSLHTFVHYGCINYKTVIQLAKAKSTAWHKFEVLSKSISFLDNENFDENQVIRKIEGTDEYCLVDLQKWCIQGDEDKKLQDMIDAVSFELKQRWKPY